jgi:hypothetical protein
MQTRAVRLCVLALLLVSGLGAGLFTWDIQQRLAGLLALERDVDARLDRLGHNVIAFGAAQQAAVLPGHEQGDALARGSTLVREIDEDLAALRSRSRSTASVAAFSTFTDTLETAVKTDARIREHLRIGQELMAADLVASEARPSIDALAAVVTELKQTERAAMDEERRELQLRAATVLAPVTGLWVLGLFLLARVPSPRAHPDLERASPDPDRESGRSLRNRASFDRPDASANLAAAAALCTDLSRVSTAAEIPELLGRAAHVLDASGLIVWMGAGEELFAATSHGYDPRMLARLGPIRRSAENATAAAWRTCAVRVVPGDSKHNGAVVAPLFGPSSALGTGAWACIGVLTAEIRAGREADPAIQAIATMIAAQLATVVAAWPAASGIGRPVAGGAEERGTTARDDTSEAADGDPSAATA